MIKLENGMRRNADYEDLALYFSALSAKIKESREAEDYIAHSLFRKMCKLDEDLTAGAIHKDIAIDLYRSAVRFFLNTKGPYPDSLNVCRMKEMIELHFPL